MSPEYYNTFLEHIHEYFSGSLIDINGGVWYVVRIEDEGEFLTITNPEIKDKYNKSVCLSYGQCTIKGNVIIDDESNMEYKILED